MSFEPSIVHGSVTTLSPFRYWCQKVLPLVYDNSLSYYELLCKVVEYLNETMENVNTIGENTNALYNSYLELVEYVNNYFTNLDVQNEINNKLDGMAESGELSALLLNVTPFIDVTKFGVVLDGITDNASALQNIINNAGNKAVLWFPSGICVINSLITIDKPLTLKNANIIFTLDENLELLISITSENVKLENIFINGNEKIKKIIHGSGAKYLTIENSGFENVFSFETVTEQILNYGAITIDNSPFTIINNCWFKNIGYLTPEQNENTTNQVRCIAINTNCNKTIVSNCTMEHAFQGIVCGEFFENETEYKNEMITFENNYMKDITKNGIYALSGVGVFDIKDNKMYNCAQSIVVLTNAIIHGNIIKNPVYRPIAIDVISQDIEFVMIENNVIDGAIDDRNRTTDYTVETVLIENNIIKNLGGYIVYLKNSNNIIIKNNIFITDQNVFIEILNGLIDENVINLLNDTGTVITDNKNVVGLNNIINGKINMRSNAFKTKKNVFVGNGRSDRFGNIFPYADINAPKGGYWEVNTILIGTNGKIHVCTESGTPGTWSTYSIS